MRRYLKIYPPVIGLIILLLASCKITKPYLKPVVDMEGLYRDNVGTDTVTIANLHWKEMFTDTLLQKIIGEGIQQNLNLKAAYSRIRQSKAYLEQSKLAFLPSLSSDASAIATGSSNQGVTKTVLPYQYQGELTTSWEADLWGKLSSAKRANLASLLQAEASARAVQTELVANIATNYYRLLALDDQLVITRQSLKNWQTTVDIMKKLKMADVVTGAAVVQSESSKYAVAVTIPDLMQSIRETENALNLLLGRVPGPVERSKFELIHPITLLQTGVPVQLLANRPDVQAAEYNFKNAFELSNVARTYFYPSLTISASGGYSSYSSFFGPGSWVSSLTAGLTQPIFNKGANKTRLKVALEQQQQAVLSFQTVVLTAGQEVSNAIYSYQRASEKKITRTSQLENLEKSVQYTQALVRYGSANYTEVLTAQQSFLAAQLSQVNDQLQQLQATVSLYRALGGGWK
ncbi:NodT family efflux transporter outer membrane factor (OMF) lipoprotein [Pedobacter cryoconitis]|uniref:NodT family efflux transporter outer membrane factor (OMF) lipoprotein n=1 Tax=Pedobacter cryoconitis TaxID=188932 RepID=A0A7W9DXU0_9SPHI|nr:efflux transporter outer membrane subunit [Pedobacter cryoconitis]MBB5634524.1 NodT family efflux transporter outer membrane factor (OMF) lipoprotein [Pedobacter cryoconitis]